jgi:hypothetical protein
MGSGMPESEAGRATPDSLRLFALIFFGQINASQSRYLGCHNSNRNGPEINGIFAKRTQFFANPWITIICIYSYIGVLAGTRCCGSRTRAPVEQSGLLPAFWGPLLFRRGLIASPRNQPGGGKRRDFREAYD